MQVENPVNPNGGAARPSGRVSAQTLARWALVRQIAELEEALADSYHCADRDMPLLWIERTQQTLAAKRVALRVI